MPSTFFKKGPPGCVALLQHCPTLGSCSCCSIFVLGLFHGEHFPPSKSSGVLLSVSSRVYTLNSQPQRHTCIRSGRTLRLQTPGERHLPNGSQLLGRSVIKANKGAAHGVRCSWISVLLKMALTLRLLVPVLAPSIWKSATPLLCQKLRRRPRSPGLQQLSTCPTLREKLRS